MKPTQDLTYQALELTPFPKRFENFEKKEDAYV